MKKIKTIFKKIPLFGKVILILILIIMLGKIYLNSKHSASKYFTDKKVIALCKAAKRGDTKKIDKLLKEGVDINTVGRTGLNPLYWLFVMTPDSKKKRIGFKYLLEKGASPTQVHTKTHWNLIHTTSRYKDSYYLKTILESGHLKPGDLDIEIEGDGWPLALMQATLADRMDNFKLLLDHGASMDKWREPLTGRTLLTSVCGGGDWKYAYELLLRGVDYTVKGPDETEPYIIRAIAGPRYWPSGGFADAIDYRQKCVEFLRKKGVEVHPWMPEGEKYITENGEDVLYIKENGQWVKYKESEKYEKKKQEEENQSWLQKWIYKKFYE